MRLESAASEMIRPFQIVSISSSLLTIRSRLRHQVNDEIEDLRFDMNGRALPAKLLLADVDLELGEPVLQGNFLK